VAQWSSFEFPGINSNSQDAEYYAYDFREHGDLISNLHFSVMMAGRTFLAWKSILDDVENMKINLDVMQIRQVKKQLDTSGGGLNRMTSECYRWLLCPVQSIGSDNKPRKLDWECFSLNGNDKSMTTKIEAKLSDEEIVIKEWSPIHLESLLKQWFWKNDKTEINTQFLWQNMCDYIHLRVDSTVNTLLEQTCSEWMITKQYLLYKL